MVKRLASDRTPVPVPEFPLWHGIPRLVPPPFGPARLPLVAAEPPPAALTPAPARPTATVWHPATPHPGADYRPPPRHRAPAPDPEPQRLVPIASIAALALVGLFAAAATYVVLHRTSAVTPAPAPTRRTATARPSPTPSQTTRSFTAAVSAIASASMIHYVGRQAAPQWEASSWDVYVTADGSMIGTETVEGRRFDVLAVGDGAYFEVAGRRNAWTTDSGLADALPAGLDAPNELAAEVGENLPGSAQETAFLDAAPAIVVVTRAGELYFSAANPQTLLRIDSVNPSGGSVETDVEPTSSTERDQVAGQLAAEAREVGAE
ncbi:MAG TPA: hypothetical protein VFN97_13150 [Actinospica sp.]|nr:hypothetical protein [Actinospica sp.]